MDNIIESSFGALSNQSNNHLANITFVLTSKLKPKGEQMPDNLRSIAFHKKDIPLFPHVLHIEDKLAERTTFLLNIVVMEWWEVVKPVNSYPKKKQKDLLIFGFFIPFKCRVRLGDVNWSPPPQWQVFCVFVATMWIFFTQKCTVFVISIHAWYYHNMIK